MQTHGACLAVTVRSLALAEAGDDVDEASVVLHAALGTTCPLFLLLLLVNLKHIIHNVFKS